MNSIPNPQYFEYMAAEWQAIVQAEERHRHEYQQRKVARWEMKIAALQKEQRTIQERGEWVRGSADMLHLIGRERR